MTDQLITINHFTDAPELQHTPTCVQCYQGFMNTAYNWIILPNQIGRNAGTHMAAEVRWGEVASTTDLLPL